MRFQFLLAVIFILPAVEAAAINLCTPQASDQTYNVPAPSSAKLRWALVWSDEFEVEGKVDANNWNNEINYEVKNQQKQFYMDREHSASRVTNGRLVIEGRREDFNGRKYTSARLSSVSEWTYGRFEFRARAPSVQGTWPAIWMLGRKVVYGDRLWLDNGEIDIMETSSNDPNHIGQSLYSHSDNYWMGRQKIHGTPVPTADTKFHNYALEWLPGRLDFYIDGEKTYSDRKLPGETWMNWPFDQDMYVIINLAIGGSLGGDVDESKLPTQFEVEYVRVYRPLRAQDCDDPTQSGPPTPSMFVKPKSGTASDFLPSNFDSLDMNAQ